jgi:hypothetical protein
LTTTLLSSAMVTWTPLGTGIGWRPMRDIDSTPYQM